MDFLGVDKPGDARRQPHEEGRKEQERRQHDARVAADDEQEVARRDRRDRPPQGLLRLLGGQGNDGRGLRPTSSGRRGRGCGRRQLLHAPVQRQVAKGDGAGDDGQVG